MFKWILLVVVFCDERTCGCYRIASRNVDSTLSKVVNDVIIITSKNPKPLPKITVHGSTFIGDKGRAMIFHGFNAVEKQFPWYPAYLLNETRLGLYKSWGFNVARLGIMWAGLEPEEGRYNETYISIMKEIIVKLNGHGIYVILDMHQDVLSSRFQSYDGVPLWLMDKLPRSPHPYPWPFSHHFESWTDGYLTQAVGKAFQGIYNNYNGTLDNFAAFWRKVAQIFQSFNGVLGYELMNEPWAGDIYSKPYLLEPGYAGQENLLPMYDRLNSEIRSVDNRTLLFYEPTTWGILLNGLHAGTGFDRVPGGAAFADRSALSVHYYCWLMNFSEEHKPYSFLRRLLCDDIIAPKVFETIKEDIHSTGGSVFLTEFGKCDPDRSKHSSATIECDYVMKLADDNLMSWTYWDSEFFYSNGSVNSVLTAHFARPYARIIGGTPISMTFATDTKLFELTYNTSMSASQQTEIYVPNLHYPHGVIVHTSVGTLWNYDRSSQTLRVYCDRYNPCPSIVHVSITPIKISQ